MQPGFLLPALALLKEPASVILPPGRFRTGRTIDFEDGVGHYQVRLTRLLGRGEDYERAGFEQVTR
jgi:cyclic-di-GMP-binding protein